MKNVEYKIEKNVLIVKIKLTEDFGPSSSGKTTIVASSEGNARIAEVDGKPVFFGLNVYKK